MRLSSKERTAIRGAVLKEDPQAQVFLFGSRVDDSLAGGDIDVLVISKVIEFHHKLNIKVALAKALGERKIDIVVTKDLDSENSAFIQSIAKKAVPIE